MLNLVKVVMPSGVRALPERKQIWRSGCPSDDPDVVTKPPWFITHQVISNSPSSCSVEVNFLHHNTRLDCEIFSFQSLGKESRSTRATFPILLWHLVPSNTSLRPGPVVKIIIWWCNRKRFRLCFVAWCCLGTRFCIVLDMERFEHLYLEVWPESSQRNVIIFWYLASMIFKSIPNNPISLVL